MLNRVFSSEAPIELEIVEPVPSSSPTPAPSTAPPAATATPKRGQPQVLPVAAAAAGLSSALVMAVAWGLWNQQQQALRQERNLVLLERLRNLGPGTQAADAAATGNAADSDLPPPGEPWIEELAQLPADGAPAADVLKVPFNTAIGNRAPAVGVPPLPPLASEGLPQLVGVVQSQGRGSSAIFQIGGSSSSAAVGETIAGSGWRLRSVAGEGAVIERGGQVRRLSISSGL